jgi:gentisate 1,2-dioxygenase
MSETRIRFEPPGRARELELWPALVIRSDEIEAEIERLADLPRPADGRRSSLFVHPRATQPGLGLAPGIRVALEVLKPGEETAPIRHNSTSISFCIRGAGSSVVAGRTIRFERFDVWNHPSYSVYWHRNDSDELQVRLSYSNAPLLEKLNVHIVDESPALDATSEAQGGEPDPRRTSPFGTFALGDDGAQLMPYETLINPPAVRSRPLHWPWREVREHLMKLESLGREYVGRRLYLLYNPITGRTNGTTPSFFATMTIRPPDIVDRPHRHTSAAINY